MTWPPARLRKFSGLKSELACEKKMTFHLSRSSEKWEAKSKRTRERATRRERTDVYEVVRIEMDVCALECASVRCLGVCANLVRRCCVFSHLAEFLLTLFSLFDFSSGSLYDSDSGFLYDKDL